MTYEIKNLNKLDTDVADLLKTNENIRNNAESLQYIIGLIRTNWVNEAGQDLASILKELEDCVTKIQGAITPTVDKYVTTMNTLAEASRNTQSNTL